jgi:hypothetical protein
MVHERFGKCIGIMSYNSVSSVFPSTNNKFVAKNDLTMLIVSSNDNLEISIVLTFCFVVVWVAELYEQ